MLTIANTHFYKENNMKRSFVHVITSILLILVPSATHAADQYFDSDGVRIRYLDEGQGEPILLIHGFGMDIERNWHARGVWQGLKKDGYRVIGVDVRGHGKSDKPQRPEDYGTNVTKDIANLLDHLGLKKVHINGYSMGGSVALSFLISYPERCKSAIVGGQGWVDPDAPGSSTTNIIVEGLESGQGIKPLMKFLHPKGAPPLTEEELNAGSDAFLARNDALAMASVLRGGFGKVTRADLEKNTVNTLLIAGGNDPLSARALLLSDIMPHVELLLISEATHGTTVKHPQYLQAIETFVDAHAAD